MYVTVQVGPSAMKSRSREAIFALPYKGDLGPAHGTKMRIGTHTYTHTYTHKHRHTHTHKHIHSKRAHIPITCEAHTNSTRYCYPSLKHNIFFGHFTHAHTRAQIHTHSTHRSKGRRRGPFRRLRGGPRRTGSEVCVYVCVNVSVYVCDTYVYVDMWICVCAHMCMCVPLCVRVPVCVCVCMCVYVYTCVYVCQESY